MVREMEKAKRTPSTAILLLSVLLLVTASVASISAGGNTESAVSENSPGSHVIGNESGEVVIVVFYGRGCPHCEKALRFLSDFEEKNPWLKVVKYEVYFNDENRKIFSDLSRAYNVKADGVPTIFVDNKVIVGWGDKSKKEIESILHKCRDSSACVNPLEKLKDNRTGSLTGKQELKIQPPQRTGLDSLTLPAVVSAAAVDSINPCAFAVLIILLSTILASGNKKRALFSGLAFSASIYISYFLMGLGIYSAIAVGGLSHQIYAAVAVLAIIVGLLNLKDYFWYGKGLLMEVPVSWRPRLRSLIKGVTSVPGAFIVGFAVSLFLLPCTSGPYIVILGLLSKAALRAHAVKLLLLYNAIFVLPMIGITTAVYYGFTSVEKAEKIRKKNLRNLHLIAGAIMVLIGVAMLLLL